MSTKKKKSKKNKKRKRKDTKANDFIVTLDEILIDIKSVEKEKLNEDLLYSKYHHYFVLLTKYLKNIFDEERKGNLPKSVNFRIQFQKASEMCQELLSKMKSLCVVVDGVEFERSTEGHTSSTPIRLNRMSPEEKELVKAELDETFDENEYESDDDEEEEKEEEEEDSLDPTLTPIKNENLSFEDSIPFGDTIFFDEYDSDEELFQDQQNNIMKRKEEEQYLNSIYRLRNELNVLTHQNNRKKNKTKKRKKHKRKLRKKTKTKTKRKEEEEEEEEEEEKNGESSKKKKKRRITEFTNTSIPYLNEVIEDEKEMDYIFKKEEEVEEEEKQRKNSDDDIYSRTTKVFKLFLSRIRNTEEEKEEEERKFSKSLRKTNKKKKKKNENQRMNQNLEKRLTELEEFAKEISNGEIPDIHYKEEEEEEEDNDAIHYLKEENLNLKHRLNRLERSIDDIKDFTNEQELEEEQEEEEGKVVVMTKKNERRRTKKKKNKNKNKKESSPSSFKVIFLSVFFSWIIVGFSVLVLDFFYPINLYYGFVPS